MDTSRQRVKPPTGAASSRPYAAAPVLQRACACGRHTAGGECTACRDERKGSAVPRVVRDVLRSSGQPLDGATRAGMESRFGQDFSRVRVHADAQAAESARAVSARAYTVGPHVVFGAGQHAPRTNAGRQLLTHELTHVVQQRAAGAGSIENARLGPADGPFEREAATLARGPGTATSHQLGDAVLQRAPLGDADPPVRSHGGTLPHREATELVECIRIMGEANAAYCRQEVLGEQLPPRPTHHQLPGITTPLPTEVGLNPDATASLRVNDIKVVFEPDVQSADPTMAGKADTTFNLSAYEIRYQASGGRVASFTGPGPIEIRIHTTYGPGATAAGPSGYGRGTTRADIAAGTTTLGFHEGRHGADFLDFMAAHRFPRFIGRVGMTVDRFEAAMRSFVAARERYRQEMTSFSEQRTHCVGNPTIDQSNAAQGIQTSICRHVPPLP